MRYLILIIFISLFLNASQKIMHDGFLSTATSGIGAITSFEASSIFQIDSTTQGMLMPRMTTTQRDAITLPATGLLIYNTTTSRINSWTGAAWEVVGGVDELTSNGDMLYYDSGLTALGIGAEGQVLTVNSSDLPEWADTQAGANAETVTGLNDFTTNSGFESGDTTGWTNSGATYSVQAVTVLDGSYSASWDAAADGNTLTSDAFTIPTKLKSNNVVFCFQYQGGDTNIRFIINDGTNDFAEETLSASTTTRHLCINSIMPSVATITLRLEADDDAAVIYADNFQVALASTVNISQISQAEFYGAVNWVATASCSWVNDAGAWASYSADSDCTTPTGDNIEGQASAPSTKIPAITFATMPAGRYVIRAVSAFQTHSASDGANAFFRFHDGTNIWKGVGNVSEYDSTSGTHNHRAPFITAEYTYTEAQENVTIEIQSYDQEGSTALTATDPTGLYISVYRYPLESQLAYTPSLDNTFASLEWQNVTNCTFTATGGVMTDADCNDPTTTIGSSTATADQLQITKTLKAGKYKVEANGIFTATNASDQTTCNFYITDGTTTLGSSRIITTADTSYLGIPGVSGQVEYTSTAERTFYVYASRDAGAGSCTCSASAANRTCSISITPVSENINMPQIIDTTYKEYDLTVSGTGWTSTSGGCLGYPYLVGGIGGEWRLRGNISGTRTSGAAITRLDLTIDGVVFKTEPAFQAVAASASTAAVRISNIAARVLSGSTTLSFEHTSLDMIQYSASFDVALDSKPTWATGIYH